ncbi:MAG: hypothetical protein DME96_10805 [Verrucomicrobia bacterium]|nr:MAG: hypothetical protein DME96_10805 [Verrucomicrobiota bacterium]
MFLSQNRRVEFDKYRQPFIRTHNKTLILVAMCVSNEDYSRVSMSFRASNYQWLPLDPIAPGVKIGLSGTLASLCEVDSLMTDSSREAQAEIRNAIAKSETAYDAKRGIIGTNLTSDTFDASRGVR